MDDLTGFPLHNALLQLEKEGYAHIRFSEIRSKKGIQGASDLRVLNVLYGDPEHCGCRISFGRFKTTVEE
ncbi:MAG: hypothetical protein IJU25_02195 [Lachnospiraceae bacterium]|nr:hypothetical protein [Lachnospiraceae bacterium]